MVRTKTNTRNGTKSLTTSWRNWHLDNYIFVFFGFFFFSFLFIDNFLNEFSKKCWVTALVRSMTFIGSLNQFKAIANLTLSQHFLEEKLSNIVSHFQDEVSCLTMYQLCTMTKYRPTNVYFKHEHVYLT